MTGRIFIDSNVWVYLFSHENDQKCELAERFISNYGNKNTIIISFQVINEVTRILKKKGFSEPDIRNVIESLAKICVIQDFSKDIALMASNIRENHSFSFWDSHIVASAITAQCILLASEDMHDRFVIDGLTIKNIFKE